MKEYHQPLLQDLGRKKTGVPAGVDPGLWGVQQEGLTAARRFQDNAPRAHLLIIQRDGYILLGSIWELDWRQVGVDRAFITGKSFGKGQGGLVFSDAGGGLITVPPGDVKSVQLSNRMSVDVYGI